MTRNATALPPVTRYMLLPGDCRGASKAVDAVQSKRADQPRRDRDWSYSPPTMRVIRSAVQADYKC